MPTAVRIASARPTFDVAVAQRHVDAAAELLRDLGAEVHRPANLVMTPEHVEDARRTLHRVDAHDLVVHACATFADASAARELYRDLDQPVLLWAFREPGMPGERLHLNSLCGANLAAHALVRDGTDVRLCYGDPDEPAVVELLSEALAGQLPERTSLHSPRRERMPKEVARAALERLQGRRIGALGDHPSGFAPSGYDPSLLRDVFGLEIEQKPLDEQFVAIDKVPQPDRAGELAAARRWQPTLDDHEPDVLDTFAATTVALRKWSDESDLDALAVRCWPEFPVELGLCPCSALSRLADEQIPTQCERDVYGAVTMLLMAALGSSRTPPTSTRQKGSSASGTAGRPPPASQPIRHTPPSPRTATDGSAWSATSRSAQDGSSWPVSPRTSEVASAS